MKRKSKRPDMTIRGKCSLFVCRICRTKFGWKHQPWCDISAVTDPKCNDCNYYNKTRSRCLHPAKKIIRREGRNKRYENDQCPL